VERLGQGGFRPGAPGRTGAIPVIGAQGTLGGIGFPERNPGHECLVPTQAFGESGAASRSTPFRLAPSRQDIPAQAAHRPDPARPRTTRHTVPAQYPLAPPARAGVRSGQVCPAGRAGTGQMCPSGGPTGHGPRPRSRETDGRSRGDAPGRSAPRPPTRPAAMLHWQDRLELGSWAPGRLRE
jgi:hypothetical protein